MDPSYGSEACLLSAMSRPSPALDDNAWTSHLLALANRSDVLGSSRPRTYACDIAGRAGDAQAFEAAVLGAVRGRGERVRRWALPPGTCEFGDGERPGAGQVL